MTTIDQLNANAPHRSKYSGILGAIGTAQPIAALLFERVILRLLQALCRSEGGVVTPAAPDVPWDFEVDKGLPGIAGPVIVEVKFLALCSDKTLAEIFATFRSISSDHPRSRLFILHGRLTPHATRTLTELQDIDPHFYVWDYDCLALRFEEPSIPGDIVEAARQSPENIVTALQTRVQSDNWKTRKTSAIEAIRRAYQERNLTLFIGAGISMGARLPSWDRLLTEISARAVGDSAGIGSAALQPILQRFHETSTSSPIVLARYLETALQGPKISTLVRDALYRDVGAGQAGRSEALTQIARLCAPRRSPAGVRSVITYNYDDLVEKHLEESSVAFHTITNGGHQNDIEQLSIYHAHGFLPRPGTDEDLGDVVLSEGSYHALYLNPYHWANIVQLNALTDSTCLFVGHSMTDPNLRRLLEASKQAYFPDESGAPPIRHYAILLRVSSESFAKRACRVPGCSNSPTVAAGPDDIAKFLDRHHDTEEAVYQQLGVGVVWVESFDEVPTVLKEIYARST